MIVFENVTQSFKTPRGMHTVLKDLNFTLPRGSKTGIVGVNGAGKSTLLNLVSGAALPSRGRIHRLGRISWPLGFAGGFNGSLSGIENCLFVSRIYGRDEREVVQFVSDFAELGEHIYLPVRSYSSGMKARLSFGLSLAFDFDFYVIDEVIAVGDARFREKCNRAFRELHAKSGIVLVSHSLAQIREYCTELGVVHDKGVTFFNSVDEGIAFYRRLTHGGAEIADDPVIDTDIQMQEQIDASSDDSFA